MNTVRWSAHCWITSNYSYVAVNSVTSVQRLCLQPSENHSEQLIYCSASHCVRNMYTDIKIVMILEF